VATPDVRPSTKTHQVTGFIDDATSMEVSLPSLTTPDRKAISDSLESRVHTIVDVLSRPIVVSSFDWTPSSIRGEQLLKLDFPQALFDSSPNMIDKLNYFAFLRADVAIRVMVNANTFQQGKLLGYFTPFVEAIGDRAVASDFLTSKTAFPYTICDASVGNTADIIIPYVAPYSSYRLRDQVGNIGTFFLVVLNSLTLLDSTVTVQAWFTNISVDLPSGMRNNLTLNSTVLNDLQDALAKGDDNVKIVKKLQKVASKYKAQVAGEDAQKSKGIISSTLHTISKIGEVASDIPMIAPVAAPLSWITKAAAQVAEYFGFCKGVNLATPSRFAQIPAFGFTNAGGLDSGLVLGSSPDNSIQHRGDMFGSKVDDMSITYVCSHRCYVDSFEFDTSQNVGTLLYEIPVAPGWCKYNAAQACFEPTLTAYVASMFNFWRGGLRYKIQAAKTAYHSGRVRITYIPTPGSDSVDLDQAYNWVFDLRNQSEIEFTIPYNNILEWAPCDLTDQPFSRTTIGSLQITVYNVLRRPDSVSPSVEFNIWVAGDSDLQFAVPTFQRYVPSKPSAELTIDNYTKAAMRRKRQIDAEVKARPKYVAQVLGTAQDQGFNDMSHKPQLFSTSHKDKLAPCKFSIGEYIMNLRYLTRRFDEAASFPLTQTSVFSLPNYYFGDLYDPEEDNISTFRIPPVDYISYIYRFFRGGIRWKAMYNGPVVSGGYQEMVLSHGIPSTREPAAITIPFYDRVAKGTNTFRHRVYNALNTICEVTAPFFSNTPIRAITGVDVKQPELLEDSSTLHAFVGFTSQTGASVEFLKAAADDFSFGWIVGPPRLRPREGQLVQLDFAVAVDPLYFVSVDNVTWVYGISKLESNQNIEPGDYKIIISDTEFIPAVFGGAGPVVDVATTTFILSSLPAVPGQQELQITATNVPPAPDIFDEAATISQLAIIGPASNGKVTVDLLRI
jgi:hypothetical protein